MPLQVAVDAQRLLVEPHTSGATYLANLLMHPPDDCDVTLLLPHEPSDLSPHQEGLLNFPYVTPSRGFDPSSSLRAQLRWAQIEIPSLIGRARAETYFAPYHLTPLVNRTRTVTTIHDFCYSDQFPISVGGAVHRSFMLSAILGAQEFICVSEFTLSEMKRRFPRAARKAQVVWNGITSPTLPREDAEQVVAELGIDSDFLMWIGYLNARKNPSLVSEVARRADLPLVAVTPPGTSLPNASFNLSGISEKQRDSLLRCARCLLFPSLCEGFGYPVAEAMRQGCPPLGLAGTVVEELTGALIQHPRPSGYVEAALRLAAEGRLSEKQLIERSQMFDKGDSAAATWRVVTGRPDR